MGALTTLVSFNNTQWSYPLGGVVFGQDGNLYGSTGFGGTNLNLAFGTLFRVTTNGDLTTCIASISPMVRSTLKLLFGN